MMDFVQQIESYSPQTHPYKAPNPLDQQPQPLSEPSFVSAEYQTNPYQSKDEKQQPKSQQKQKQKDEKLTGLTRFCKQKYYSQYFKVSEKNVIERVLAAVMPPFNDQFIELIKPSPDLYGLVWIMTTIVFLLGIVGNFANYMLSKFSDDQAWQGYFFRLELVRYAIVFVYSFAAGVPLTLFFMFKFMKCTHQFIKIACLYGYSMSCYIPALILCILPIQLLQWLLLIYAFANSTFFLALSLRKHIEGLKAKFLVVFGVLGALQLVFFLCTKLIFVRMGPLTDS